MDNGVDLINEGLVNFNNTFAKAEYPGVRIADFMNITQVGNFGDSVYRYAEQIPTYDPASGRITSGTTSFDQADLLTVASEAKYYTFTKTVSYTYLALEQARRLNLQLDFAKVRILREEALLIQQAIALIGSPKIGGTSDVTGLLNHPKVGVELLTSQVLPKFKPNELIELILTLARQVISNSVVTPVNTLVLESSDLALLAVSTLAYQNGEAVSVMSVLEKQLSALAGEEFRILGLPPLINTSEVTRNSKFRRMCFYRKSPESVIQDVACIPTVTDALQKSHDVYEVAIRAAYTGAVIFQPHNFMYFDYPVE